ncbi:MAG: oligosaccharide flippase family protein [Hyphomicrobiaceae bacterium]
MQVKSLVKSTLLLGSTSAAIAVIGIFRVKALALLIGPAGLGLLGTLSSLASCGTTLFAVGADTSGTRRTALARNNPVEMAHLRRVLLLIAVIHGTLAISLFWVFGGTLSQLAFGTDAYRGEIASLGLVVTLSLVAGLQIALLQGLGRVATIARIGLIASVLSTILGLWTVWQFGFVGIFVLLLAQPAISAILASWMTPRQPNVPTTGLAPHETSAAREWRGLMVEGAPFMVSYVALALMPLAVRTLVIHSEGLDAAGYFHAAWTMSVIYVGFLLKAMSADYFPRLSGMIEDKEASTTLINDQILVGLAIGGPVLLLMIAGSAWIIPLLFSKAFSPAIEVLEWQAFGHIMKIAGWPSAFLSMARGRSVQFLVLELSWTLVFVVLVWAGLPWLGLASTGIAFAIACAAFLAMQIGVAYWSYGFRLRRDAVSFMIAFLAMGSLTLLAAYQSPALQAATGGSAAVLLGIAGLREMLSKTGVEGRLGAFAARLFDRIGWPLAAPAPATAE